MQLNMVNVLAALFYSTAYFFSLCYGGEFTTNIFFKYGNRLYELEWLNLPVQLQKDVIVMMQNMQRPLIYSGFGLVELTFQSFTKVKSQTVILNEFP